MHARRLSPLLLTIVALSGACAGMSKPDGDAQARRPPSSLTWRPCGSVECATLSVPLDHARPDGETIRLALARRLAQSAEPHLGVLAVNPGGPGASGIDALARLPLPPGVADRFDIVTWDPRGVGASTPVRCEAALDAFAGLDPDPDDRREQSGLAQAARGAGDRCTAASGRLLPHLGTDEHAADLDDVRRALGEDRISYVGYSYGTRLGLAYLAAHPDRVRAMVLDGVVDPLLPLDELLLDQAVALERAIERGFDRCRRDGCIDSDPRALLDRVAEAVEPGAGSGGIGADAADLAFAVTRAGYSDGGVERLIGALAQASSGDPGPLVAQADEYRTLGDRDAYTAISCIDGPHPVGAKRWQSFAERASEVAPTVGAAVANELLPCATWSVSPAPASSPPPRATPAGGPTVLLLSNTGDPATPPHWARAVASRFEEVALIEVDAEGHTVLAGGDQCALTSAAEVLLSPRGTRPAPCP